MINHEYPELNTLLGIIMERTYNTEIGTSGEKERAYLTRLKLENGLNASFLVLIPGKYIRLILFMMMMTLEMELSEQKNKATKKPLSTHK